MAHVPLGKGNESDPKGGESWQLSRVGMYACVHRVTFVTRVSGPNLCRTIHGERIYVHIHMYQYEHTRALLYSSITLSTS